MFLRSFRRNRLYKHSIVRLIVIVVALCLTWDAFTLVFYSRIPHRVSPTTDHVNHGRILIASMHWNNEPILRSHWNDAVLDLVKHFGPTNVFVAVLESGSWDNSKGALRELESHLASLDVARSIVLEDTSHVDEVSRTPLTNETGWILTSRGRKELRRITYLANIRNRVMEEMHRHSNSTGTRFDKVLWLNDVVFNTEDILTLLSTNDGHYAAACSLDFSKPPVYYDTFALRDLSGSKTVSSEWPYYFSGASRSALVSGDAVPVRSCWNGMVAMDAEPFYATPPLSFRGVPDSLAEHHLEGSECCLIHADNPLSQKMGVYVNPNVRVGYNGAAYEAVNAFLTWPSPISRVTGIWKARLATFPAMLRYASERLTVSKRLSQWGGEEPGTFCLVNEMQILVENGWKHL